MAYAGKFFDRNPRIQTAGVQADRTHGVPQLLQHVSLEDQVNALKYHEGILTRNQPLSAPMTYPVPPDSGTRYEGPYNQMADVVSPPVGTDFQQVRSELMETSYPSHWQAPLGSSSYQPPNLPGGFISVATTLGMPSHQDGSVAELVNPPKRAGQVLFENSLGHELYVRSHQDYYPGEQVSRNYLPGSYDSTEQFGVRTPSDPRGIGVPLCVTWINNEPFTVASNKQADIIVHRPQVGKTLLRDAVLGNLVPADHTFGIRTPPSYIGVQELIHFGGMPRKEKRSELDYVQDVNSVRLCLFNNQYFNWKDFEGLFRHFDKKRRGVMQLNDVYWICRQFNLVFNRPLIEPLMRRLAILFNKECVVYERFIQMINPNFEFPSFKDRIDGVHAANLHYDTTHGVSFKQPIWEDVPAAGVPSVRNDLEYPQALINALKESLGDETDVRALINPSLMTRSGLNHRDLFLPRTLQQLVVMFMNMDIQISDEIAYNLYMRGLQMDKTGGVCVETFRNLLDELCEARLQRSW